MTWTGTSMLARTSECKKKERKPSQVNRPAGVVELMTSVTRRAGRFLDAQKSLTFPTSSTMSSPVQTNR